MAQFAANNNKSAFIKLFLFFTIKDLHSRMSFDKVELSNTSTYKQIFNQKVLKISGNM